MKRILKVIFWAFFFLMMFRIAIRTPLNHIVFNIEAGVIALLLLFLILRLLYGFTNRMNFSKYELYLLFFLIFPFWSAIAAYNNWGQPLFYGIATQRSFFLFTSCFYLMYKLKRGDVDFSIIKDSFLVLAWGCLVAYIITAHVVNPAAYIETEFVGYNELKGGYIFKFLITFLMIGFLYYFIKAFKTRQFHWLIPGTILFIYIAFVRQDRSITLTAFGTFGLYYMQHELKRNFFKTLLGGMVVIAAFLVFVINTSASSLSTMLQPYENVLKILEGSSTTESATNARRLETIKALPYISRNLIMGNGDLSLQYRNGYTRIFGYFYPSDIGIIGEFFLFGVLGVLLLNSQFIVGWYYGSRPKMLNDDVFFLTCKYTLFTFFMDSLSAGQPIYFSANCLIIITILAYYNTINNQLTNQVILEQSFNPSKKLIS